MRRNLRNEVLMAVGGLGIIICGLIFAILLSGTTDIGDSTAIVESNTDDITATTGVTVEMTTTTSVTQEKPTALVETNTPVVTNTDAPADTPIPTETDMPSNTPVATNTDAPIDTPAPSNTPLPSDTPTSTETDMPSDTPVPTETVAPSDTPVPKNTELSSSTLQATAIESIATGFTGLIPTLPPSPTVVPPDEPTRTPASCRLPDGWTIYRVQSGDTLFAISLVTNSSVDELRFANCINNIDNITAGDTIFVPVAPVRPVSTSVPTHLRGGLVAIGCTSPATQITSPITAQRVSGTFTVFGTATRPDFQYYKIEVRPDFASIYNFYSDSRSQISNGNLGQINADLFGPGLHWIRLSVVDLRASIPADAICEIPVIFE